MIIAARKMTNKLENPSTYVIIVVECGDCSAVVWVEVCTVVPGAFGMTMLGSSPLPRSTLVEGVVEGELESVI